MLQFTCGSKQPIDYDRFDGIVAGYHLSLWDKPLAFDIPDKIYRAQFLYGHRDKQCPLLGLSMEDWVKRRVTKFPQVNEWVLVNEFTDDLGVPYPSYGLDDLKKYCEAAHLANPDARLILGDFKPYLLKKWGAIAKICQVLKADGFPVEIGIQTHIKTYNAPVILSRLPSIIEMFDIPVHLLEASLWYRNEFDSLACNYLWGKLEGIAKEYNVKSFCNWWLCDDDTKGRRMPTFENLKLFVGFNIESHVNNVSM